MTSRPHDALFKAAFETPANAAALVRSVLPEAIHTAIDWSSMARESGSFIDPDLADRHSDLLFSVELAGRPALIYLLLEHQSTVATEMPLRMLDYLVRVWMRAFKDRGLPLPLMLAVAVTHAPGGWTAPRTLHALIEPPPESLPAFAPMLPSYTMQLLDLVNCDDERLRGWATDAFAELALLLLRDGRDSARLREILERRLDLLREALGATDGASAVAQLLRYIALVAKDMNFEEFRATLTKQIPEAGEIAMTIAEELRQEGRQQGLQQGQARTLIKLITLEFGPPSPEHAARIEAASPEQLDRYIERILSAESIEELLAK